MAQGFSMAVTLKWTKCEECESRGGEGRGRQVCGECRKWEQSTKMGVIKRTCERNMDKDGQRGERSIHLQPA